MKNNITNIITICFILLLPLLFSYGQAPIVKKIEFIGYEKTKPYILNREIHHPIDAPLDSSLAENDRLRLENLGIFSLVDMQIFKRAENEVVIRYTVIEAWRFFPVLTPIYDEKWGWSVGAMLMIKNFRGRDESLIIQGQYGGQNTMGIEFSNPWITGNHISMAVSIGNDIYDHTFLPYEVNSRHFQIGVGKYFSEFIRTKAGISINDKTFTNDNEEHDYLHILPYSNFVYDSRDLYANPSKGILSSHTLLVKLDTKGNAENLLLWNQSSSSFYEINRGRLNTVLGLNMSSTLSFGKEIDIWFDYIGGAYTVRGWNVPNSTLFEGQRQDYRFGMNWITSSIEVRQTIVPKFVTKIGNELGLSLVAFTDIGVIDNNISHLINKTPIIGLGVGIRIPWSVIKAIRLDYGWSFYNGKYIEHTLHLAFGEKF